MINTSLEWRRYCADIEDIDARQFTAKAIITLVIGTVLSIDNTDIAEEGVKLYEGTSSTGSFDIGSAIINNGRLILNNIEGKFSNYNFDGAQVILFSGLQLSNSMEWIRRGTYIIKDSNIVSSIAIMEFKDNMSKTERLFSEVGATFPITAFNLLSQTCSHCNVLLETASILNGSLVIQRDTTDESTTCREIISWIAQLSGNFAKFNADGKLELKWYDFEIFETSDNLQGGTFETTTTPYSDGDTANGGDFTFSETTNYSGGTFADMRRYHHIFSLGSDSTGTDDVVITGIQVNAKGTTADYGETSLFGQQGYVLEISDNPLIQEGNASTIANSVGAKIVGMRFRTMNISALSDTSIEAGDVAYKSDRKGKVCQTLITNLSYTIGSFENFTCDAESPSKNSEDRAGAITKVLIQARKQTEEQINVYDLVAQQFSSIMANAMGYFPIREVQEDGSFIDYMCDKPTLEESMIIYKKSISGFASSIDGGVTWVGGYTADGNILAKVLTAIGINCEWLNVGTKLGGFTLNADTLSSTISKTFGPFTNDDVTYIHQFIVPNSTVIPTAADVLKYDITGDGKITLMDSIYIQRIISGADSPTVTGIFKIDPKSLRETLVIERLTGPGAGSKTALGAGSMYTNSFACDTAIIANGKTGTFTSTDGKTVTVTSGIITSIA